MVDPARVTVVIPAYNEEDQLGRVLQGVRRVSEHFEVIVVDDGSTDRTAEIAKSEGAQIVSHPYNMGNGAAVKSGARAATRAIIVYIDADEQHDPAEIPRFLEAIDDCDMVVGARTGPSDESPVRRVGNWCITRVARYISQMPIEDLTCGYRAIRRERMLEFLHLLPNQYSYPTTITLSLMRSGYRVKYLRLRQARRRRLGTSHINLLTDGTRFLIIILRMVMLFDPLKIFLPASLALFALMGAMFVYDIVAFGRIKASLIVVAVVAFLTFFFGLLADQIAQMRRDRR